MVWQEGEHRFDHHADHLTSEVGTQTVMWGVLERQQIGHVARDVDGLGGRARRVSSDVQRMLEISLEAIAKDSPTSTVDRDRIILECLPRTTPCPDAGPPTTTTLPGLSTNPTIIVGAGGGVRFEPDIVRIRAGDTVRCGRARGPLSPASRRDCFVRRATSSRTAPVPPSTTRFPTLAPSRSSPSSASRWREG